MKARRELFALCASLALALPGCDARRHSPLQPNQPPDVILAAQRVDRSASGPITYRFTWSASDPDERVEHFLYAVGSPAEDDDDLTWERTSDRERVLTFERSVPPGDPAARGSIEPRIFKLVAVDASGARSAAASVAVFEGNIAPTVFITNPPPNPLVRYYLCPTIRLDWDGTDPDGVFTNRPVKYKYKMLTDQTEVTLQTARSFPDSVRRYYAPRNWAGWDSTTADTTHKLFTGLTPDQEYVFVVTGFDEVGDYDPIFSYSTNMIYMRIVFPNTQLPQISMFNEFFLYSYAQGRFDPAPALTFEAPAGRPITFNWFADPIRNAQGIVVGGPIRGYRWALDIKDLADETPRRDEATELDRWSQWSPSITSATLPAFRPAGPDPEPHTLYVEATDDLCAGASLPALGVVRFNVVRPSFTNDLLIVDDTRLALDKRTGTTGTCIDRPIGNWPMAAELDTFLYARGGVPWRCYPAGTMSTPGILAGYAFDTLGTNLRIQNLTIPLSTLSRYRHVVWLVDGMGALNSKPGTDMGDLAGPQTSMRYMNSVGGANTLAAYVGQGGLVWLAGGGASTAALINFNRTLNDQTPPNPRTLTFRNFDGELVPGRFIYDQAHWRSEFKLFKVNSGRIRRYLGRFEANPGVYAGLPVEIQVKSPATDPFPPNRTSQSPSVFYQTQFDIEFLSAANEIVEDLDPGPLDDLQSTLDTLFKVTASALQPDTGQAALQSVAMTYYHGIENAPIVSTGFNLWSFRRAQCIQLVDFVLQQLWGLPRAPVSREPNSMPPAIASPGHGPPIGRQRPAVPEGGAVRGAGKRSPSGQGR